MATKAPPRSRSCSSSSSCSSCSSSSGSSSSSTNSNSSSTSSSFSSSSSSSESSSSSSSSQSSLADESKKCVKRLLHSQSCHDICRERRAFEDDEDTKPLLDGHVNKSASVKHYLSSGKKHTASVRSCHRRSGKGSPPRKNGQTENIRKAKSMEVLPRKTDPIKVEYLDEEEAKRRKEEAKQKILKDKANFSAFLNEITRQVFSPSKLKNLGVTNLTGPVSPTASPAKSSDSSEIKENQKTKSSPRSSKDASSAASCSPLHTCKQSITKRHHHHHKAKKINSSHSHRSLKCRSFSSTGSSKCQCPEVEHGHGRHKKHPIQTSGHETDDEHSTNKKRITLRHQSPSPIPGYQHAHHDHHRHHHGHPSEHHHHQHHRRSHRKKSPHHSSRKHVHHPHHDYPHPESHHHRSSHSSSKSHSPQPRSHHSPSLHQHHPEVDHYADSESCRRSLSPSCCHRNEGGTHGCPSAHHSPNSHSESQHHHQHHGDQKSPSKCQQPGRHVSRYQHDYSPFNANQQNIPRLHPKHSKCYYSSLPDVHDSFTQFHPSDQHSTQDHHHHSALYDSHFRDNADLHHSVSEHHLSEPHYDHHDHRHSFHPAATTHCEPRLFKSSSSEAEKQHPNHRNPIHHLAHSEKSKIPEHPKPHHRTHHPDTQFYSEGHYHYSHPTHNSHPHRHHLQAPQYDSHSRSDLQPNRDYAHGCKSPELHKTLHIESHTPHQEHPEAHQRSYSDSLFHHTEQYKPKTQKDFKSKSHSSSHSHIFAHPESNLHHEHPDSHHQLKHSEACSSFLPDSPHPSHDKSHHEIHLQSVSCLDCMESYQYPSQTREHDQQDYPNLRRSPVGQQATSSCSSKSDSFRSPTSQDDHPTVKPKVAPIFQDAQFKPDNPFKQASPSVAPPPVQFMDRDVYKGSVTGEDQPLGAVPEEGESDWSEMGEEAKHCTMTSLEAGHHRSHHQQNYGWWVKVDQFRRGDGDTESESGDEESTRRLGLQVPHLQFTVHPESSSTGPTDPGYQMSTGRQLCSSMRMLSASLEEVNSAGMPQLENRGQLFCTTDLMDIHGSRVSPVKDCTKDVCHDWTKVDGVKGARRSGHETAVSMANLESAQKMLNHFIHDGDRTQL